MINYLEQLQGTIKNNWGAKALSNFQGEDFTFGELATTIEEFHCFFRKIGIRKGDKIPTAPDGQSHSSPSTPMRL